ncbi:hypothetical protein CP980_34825 [Streptomyces vinaceus]|uniref:Uncharacterized protein n=1 Tax=Streptomyces vinaceus TaxID=1960 RepID=A0A5J6JNV6_STRVI|nr:hypothetical protein CP980_34825 [Streptomyces vinaceus]GHE46256.1 hypothetical protein GCM10017778_32690 [Streptomyces vinaceus]
MRQWEDLRGTTGVLDFFAELTVDVDAILEEAERYYSQTKNHFDDALRVESEARETCIADIRAAYRQIPEFKGTIPDPEQFLRGLGPLQSEAREARANPNVQLPGAGPKVDSIPTVRSDVVVSEALMASRAGSTDSRRGRATTTGCGPTPTTAAASTSRRTRI